MDTYSMILLLLLNLIVGGINFRTARKAYVEKNDTIRRLEMDNERLRLLLKLAQKGE